MTAGVDLNDIKRRMDGAINAFKNDIASLRTGRASANVLDPVVVEAYGSRVPLNQVANVTVPSRACSASRSGTSPWSMPSTAPSAKPISASTRSSMARTCGSRCRAQRRAP